MISPHLPVKSCSIRKHNNFIYLKLIILVAILGVLAGIAGSLVALGWIWPGYGGGDIWVVSHNNSSDTQQTLEDIVHRESTEKTFAIYNSISLLNGVDYLSTDNKIGDGLVVGSDGWLAVYVSKLQNKLIFKDWKALSSSGIVFNVDKFIWDAHTHFVYLKISQSENLENNRDTETNFKVVSFSDSINLFDEVFVSSNKRWQASRLGYIGRGFFDGSHLDSSPNSRYKLDDNFSVGSIVITSKGRVVGFIDDDGMMLPSFYVSRILPSILSSQKIEYPSFGVYGWFSDEHPIVSKDNQQINGFFVKNIWSKKTNLKRGDIITKIDGQIVLDESLWYNLIDKNVNLTILRDGKMFDLEVPVLIEDIGILN